MVVLVVRRCGCRFVLVGIDVVFIVVFIVGHITPWTMPWLIYLSLT